MALTAIKPLPFDASQWKIHTCSKGFISTKNVLSNQINTYNPAFNSIGVLGLNATFLESDYLVRADTFFWAGLHSIGDLDDRLWVLSDTVGQSGVWNTGTDIQLTDIALGGVPTGTTFMVPIPWVPTGTHTAYSANYSNVLVTVKNTGSDTIHHCKVQCLWVSSCAELCGNFEGSIEVSFDQLLLAPGESTVLDLDTLEVYCSNQNLENLCLNVTEVNHRREKNDLNNANCTYIPNLYVGTHEPRLIYVEVTPNPATDVLHIELSDSSEPSTYAIYSLDGKMIKKGDFNAGEPVVVAELSGGFYWFTLTDNDGRVGRRGFVKAR